MVGKFCHQVQGEVCTYYELQQLARDFHDLQQMMETMADIASKFRERALFVPQYAVDEEVKKSRYHNMLRAKIREFVSFSFYQTLEQMIDRTREREIKLELQKKRKSPQVQTVVVSATKYQNLIHNQEANMVGVVVESTVSRTMEFFRVAGFVVSSVASHDTLTRIASRGTIIFPRNQVRYKKADCQSLASGEVRLPAPSTIRIPYGLQGKSEAPVVRSRAFYLTDEEARATLNVFTNIFPIILIIVFVLMLIFFV